MKVQLTNDRTGRDKTSIETEAVRVLIPKAANRCALTIHISDSGIVIDGTGWHAGQLHAISFDELMTGRAV